MTVIKIQDATVRKYLEDYTRNNCMPDVIEFVQDANSNWIMSKENLSNSKYQAIISQILQNGEEIEYIPKP